MSFVEPVRERLAHRPAARTDTPWQELEPAIWPLIQEKERALIRWLQECDLAPPDEKRVLDLGCGGGGDLRTLIQLGFDPAQLTGCELLPERAAAARHRLPKAVRIEEGDALEEVHFEPESFDIVLQSMMFTSLLEEPLRERLAAKMWDLVRPGGGVLWFDFVYDNPRNPGVTGIPVSEVHSLFPEGEFRTWRVVLAPPIARRVTRFHPKLYGVLNTVPFLRTHVLCWITKPNRAARS